MSEAQDDKKPNPQEKLREIIREEIRQCFGSKEIDSPKNRVITVLCGAVFVTAVVGMISALLMLSVHYSNEKESKVKSEAASVLAVDTDQLRPDTFQQTHPLEFIVGSNAALMVNADQKTEQTELTRAVEIFSKRRDHNIGEGMGAVPNEKSGKLLDREATLEAFELALGFLAQGGAVPGFDLQGEGTQPLSKNVSIREERLINKIQKAIASTSNPAAMTSQVKSLNAFWHESEYYGEGDANQIRDSYKVMAERILRRIDNTQG